MGYFRHGFRGKSLSAIHYHEKRYRDRVFITITTPLDLWTTTPFLFPNPLPYYAGQLATTRQDGAGLQFNMDANAGSGGNNHHGD